MHSDAPAQVRDKRPPLVINLYSSVLIGVSESDAVGHSQPLVNFLSAKKLRYPMEISVRQGSTPEDLRNFSDAIKAGECHLGVALGLEFGWLRELDPTLEPLAQCSAMGRKGGLPIQAIVHTDFKGEGFASLQGKTMGLYDRFPMMNQVYIDKMTKGHKGKFFGDVTTYPKPNDALMAVHKGKVQVVFISADAYRRHIANYTIPGSDGGEGKTSVKLKSLLISEPFPEPVIFGSPAAVDKLRKGLWREMQNCLSEAHETAEGQMTMDFFRTERFLLPDERFAELVRDSVREFPFRSVESPGDDE